MASPLLSLPRELRDIIYELCVWSEGGYSYNFETNKLKRADGGRIDASLALTCRQIADEMSGLPLTVNQITFSTFFSEQTREQTGRFHSGFMRKMDGQALLLRILAPKLLTSSMARIASERYPMFAPILENWRQKDRAVVIRRFRYTSCGEAPSIFADFVQFTLNLLAEHEDFFKEAKAVPRFWSDFLGCKAVELCNAPSPPWIIPTVDELDAFDAWSEPESSPPRYFDHLMYSYSAASAALRFFQSVSIDIRMHIRHVVLREDYESVVRPASHGRGFIPFCLENPQLRVERFVNLWQNAFPVRPKRWYLYGIGVDMRMRTAAPDSLRDGNNLSACAITKSVGEWIVECLLLPSLGMPQRSFTLVLDGKPVPEATTAAFSVVQRDAAWQTALDLCYACGRLPKPSWINRRQQTGYMYEELPKAIREVSQTSSLVRCNFNPGVPYDPEALVEARTGWSQQDWEQDWAKHEPQTFETESPLPPWHVLRWHRVLPCPGDEGLLQF